MPHTRRCTICGRALVVKSTGRPQRFCSPGCRQRAYRLRRAGRVAPPMLPEPRKPSPGERPVPHLAERELLAWRGLLEAHARLLPALDEELRAGTGLSVSEFDVLYQLWVRPGGRARMKTLATALLITRSGATRVVQRLAGAGLVRKLSQPGEQAVVAELTPEGERRLGAAMDVHFAGVRRRFVETLSGAEVETLARVWQRLATGTVEPSTSRE